MERILIVEDDHRLADHVGTLVRSAGFAVQLIGSMSELDHCLSERHVYNAVILDRLLAGIDTKSRVHQIKRRWPSAPILVLSAINTPLERAELLNLGVDDYLGKPFLSQELLARLRALLRRFQGEQASYREIGDLVLDLPRRILIRGTQQETLPAKEFLLIKLLTDQIGRVMSKAELLDLIWAGALDVETNVVEATITNLRRKLTSLGSDVRLRNSRNVGYWIES